MPYRIQRFSSTLKHSLGEILLNELSNPEFRFISISEVSLSNDLKKARVFISSPNDNIDEILIQLKKAKGFIKKLLPEKINRWEFIGQLLENHELTGKTLLNDDERPLQSNQKGYGYL